MSTVEETRALVQQAVDEMVMFQDEIDWIEDSLDYIDHAIESAARQGETSIVVGAWTGYCDSWDVGMDLRLRHTPMPWDHLDEALDIIGDIYEEEGYQVSWYPDRLSWLHKLLGKDDMGSHVYPLKANGDTLYYKVTISW